MWRRQSRSGNLGHTPRFRNDTNGIQRHPNSVRATIVRQGNNNLILTGWSIHENDTPFTFQENHNTTWLYQDMQGPTDPLHFKQSIETGNVIAVSDGSFLNEQQAGSAGWYIEDRQELQQLRGSIPSPGSKDSQCSHRSELVGLLGIISHINRFCSQHNVHHGTISVGCDGIGALQATKTTYTVTSSHKHFDLICSIKNSIKHSPLSWQFFHVKGHQDNYTHYDDLSREAQLNVQADDLAKGTLHRLLQTPGWSDNRPQHLPYKNIEIYWTNKHMVKEKIYSNLKKTLTTHIQTTTLRNYWIKKKKFSQHTETYVDWTVSKKVD
jgi:hypothetical protein